MVQSFELKSSLGAEECVAMNAHGYNNNTTDPSRLVIKDMFELVRGRSRREND